MNLVKTIAYLSTLIMGGIIIWANSKSNFLADAGKVAQTEWGIVTLVDLYIGFIFVGIWMCFREKGFSRVAWLIGLFFLGNLTRTPLFFIFNFLHFFNIASVPPLPSIAITLLSLTTVP